MRSAGQRCRGRGLQDDRRTDGEGRGDLVGAQVQREVEGRDTQDDAPREAPGEGEPPLPGEVGVQPLGLAAVEPAGLLGRDPEHRDGPADLSRGPT